MPQTSTRICAGALRPATSVLVCRALRSGFGLSRAMAGAASSAATIAALPSFWMTRLKSVFIVGPSVGVIFCATLDQMPRHRRPRLARNCALGRDDKESPLALVARQHALHRAGPAGELPLARGLAHVGLEAMLEAPIVGELGRLGIDA